MQIKDMGSGPNHTHPPQNLHEKITSLFSSSCILWLSKRWAACAHLLDDRNPLSPRSHSSIISILFKQSWVFSSIQLVIPNESICEERLHSCRPLVPLLGGVFEPVWKVVRSSPLSLHIMHERSSRPQFKRSNRTGKRRRCMYCI